MDPNWRLWWTWATIAFTMSLCYYRRWVVFRGEKDSIEEGTLTKKNLLKNNLRNFGVHTSEDVENRLNWNEENLAFQGDAKWVFVVGPHPLIEYQHLRPSSPIAIFTSGAGSRSSGGSNGKDWGITKGTLGFYMLKLRHKVFITISKLRRRHQNDENLKFFLTTPKRRKLKISSTTTPKRRKLKIFSTTIPKRRKLKFSTIY
ncbi:6546_t:CDS:2 [Cetraspora pellucida]|uniref:6546_t:CDS:1 n=1 Tax=Cetraspora pellucida TaxID=1433469 RepID=A0ACA9K3M4_9GLOM|nr:6546_t:CDS:2 [Cetraspora pellucida]